MDVLHHHVGTAPAQAGARDTPVDLLKLVEANYRIEGFALIDQGSH
jgi:hypothetical protein